MMNQPKGGGAMMNQPKGGGKGEPGFPLTSVLSNSSERVYYIDHKNA